ncbi:MAG: carbohydrate kinase family protein [Actinomycetota bacterium]
MSAPDLMSDPADVPVLVVGEALIDVVIPFGGQENSAERLVGGSPTNVAGGLARLGHHVTLATRIGNDADGILIAQRMEADGVLMAPESTPHGRTSTAVATIGEDGAASYTFDVQWDLAVPDVRAAGHVHVGSISANLAPGAVSVQAAVAAAASLGATVSYDPNLRPAIIGDAERERTRVMSLVAHADVVKTSDEDVAWLHPGESASDIACRWVSTGPGLVVITRGADGALIVHQSSPSEPIQVSGYRVPVVDTVGAGDAFMAGLLSGLLDAGLLGRGRRTALNAATRGTLMTAVERALRTSSVTCTRAGANPPWRSELT